MHIDDYFAEPLTNTLNRHGTESEWLDLGHLALPSGTLAIGDATLFPGDQFELNVEPGIYLVQAKVVDYGIDQRIARLRVCLPGASFTRRRAGKISVDFAVVSACDLLIFLAALERTARDEAQLESLYFSQLDNQMYGIIKLAEKPPAMMAFVRSGWGDGRYTVYRLVGPAGDVGIEAVFIAEGEQYPFEAVKDHQIIGG